MAKTRAVITVVGCLAAGLALEAHRPAGRTPPADAAAQAPDTANAAAVPPPADPSPPIETPYRVVLAALDREAYPDVEQHGATLRVSYRLDASMMTVAAGRRAFDRNAGRLVPELLARFPGISTVEMEADAPTTDPRGNKGRGLAASITFTRQNAGTIRWEVIDSANIEWLADLSWYGPGFR